MRRAPDAPGTSEWLAATSTPPIDIRPAGRWPGLGVRELWEHRELIGFLVWRDVTLRYRQTVLGVLWAVLQPLIAMVIFSVVFGRLARMPSDALPYPVWSYAGLVPWTYLAQAVTQGANSVVNNVALITKVYFPRAVIPLAAAAVPLIDLAVALSVLALLMVVYGIMPSRALALLPAVVLLGVVTAVGTGLCLAALNARYRDVRYVVPFFVQVWLFATPVVYPSSLVPEPWRILLGLNPAAGFVEGVRAAVFGTTVAPELLAVSCASALAILAVGAVAFRRMEETLADVV